MKWALNTQIHGSSQMMEMMLVGDENTFRTLKQFPALMSLFEMSLFSDDIDFANQ